MTAPAPAEGIFGTDIDLTGLDPKTILRLAAWTSDQMHAAERYGAIRAIRETLVQAAGWINDTDADTLRTTASAVAVLEHTDDWLDPTDLAALTCVLCEEIICDAGCPLERYRLTDDARRAGTTT